MSDNVYVVEESYGSQRWRQNGVLHREHGPALIRSNGAKYWYKKGKLHREDGPAFQWESGDDLWYLDGVNYTEEEFNKKMNPVKELTVAEVSALLGYEVKIVK